MDLILILFIVIISSIAYIYLRYNFNTYRKVVSKSDLSGFEVARKILDIHDMNDVYITAVSGRYSDHYNSSRKVIKLSKGDSIKNIFTCNGNVSIKITRVDEVLEIHTEDIPMGSSVSTGVKLCKDGIIKAELIRKN